MSKRGSLVVVGSGIRSWSQVTPEAHRRIVGADKVFYLSADEITAKIIVKANPRSATLNDLYSATKPRAQTYAEMVERILTSVRSGNRVCVVLYGHPGVFANPAHEAIRIARAEGYEAMMLPGVSAEDCLYADLGLDPGLSGSQTFEATDFLIRERRFDETSLLILLQIGAIGVRESCGSRPCWNPGGLNVLLEALQARYGIDHEVILYLAAAFPLCNPYVRRTSLAQFSTTDVPLLATLVVPPMPPRPVNSALLLHLESLARAAIA